MWDLYKSSDALIGHGTGIVHVNGMHLNVFHNSCTVGLTEHPHFKVEFGMVVFRPFKGEILLGKISSASQHGIKSTTSPCMRANT